MAATCRSRSTRRAGSSSDPPHSIFTAHTAASVRLFSFSGRPPMAASTYDDALRRLLVHEGGYSNHPSDPGGPTTWGITLRDARAYWKKDATASDVRNLPRAVA